MFSQPYPISKIGRSKGFPERKMAMDLGLEIVLSNGCATAWHRALNGIAGAVAVMVSECLSFGRQPVQGCSFGDPSLNNFGRSGGQWDQCFRQNQASAQKAGAVRLNRLVIYRRGAHCAVCFRAILPPLPCRSNLFALAGRVP